MKTEKKWHLSRQMKTNLVGYSFILPNILGVCAFTLFPMIFFADCKLYRLGLYKRFWKLGICSGLKNFIDMWKDEWFTSSLINTIVFAIVVVPATVFLALVLSVIIDKYCKAKLPIRLALFMPYISNIVAVAIVWVMMYSPWGPFTQMVQTLGVRKIRLSGLVTLAGHFRQL